MAKQADINDTWAIVGSGVNDVFKNFEKGFDVQRYMDVYTTIHNYCTSQKSCLETARMDTRNQGSKKFFFFFSISFFLFLFIFFSFFVTKTSIYSLKSFICRKRTLRQIKRATYYLYTRFINGNFFFFVKKEEKFFKTKFLITIMIMIC